MSKIEIVELDGKLLAVLDKQEIINHIDKVLCDTIVDRIVERHTSYMFDTMSKIMHEIEKKVVNKTAENFYSKNATDIFKKIDIKTIANMASINIAKKVRE